MLPGVLAHLVYNLGNSTTSYHLGRMSLPLCYRSKEDSAWGCYWVNKSNTGLGKGRGGTGFRDFRTLGLLRGLLKLKISS